MRLKFGRVVDLDRLEGVVTNRTVEDLRAKLRAQEAQQAKQLADLQVSLTLQDTHLLYSDDCSSPSLVWSGPSDSWWVWSERTHST